MAWNFRIHRGLSFTSLHLVLLLLLISFVSACSLSPTSGPTATSTPTSGIAGKFTEFALPPSPLFPGSITQGPDGDLWFTEVANNQTGKIGRIPTAGVISEFSLPTSGNSPSGITSGPDGKLWFTESEFGPVSRNSKIGQLG